MSLASLIALAAAAALAAGQGAAEDSVARGQRTHVLRMTIARVDDQPFTTNDHDAKKRPIAHGITARISGGKPFSGVVADYPTGQKPGRSTRLSVCT